MFQAKPRIVANDNKRRIYNEAIISIEACKDCK